ncbi:hypothetical protein CASFOL_041920 [Castilleja foliolosa]|uniref:RING-type E3 ubiquitin transferase n=1 Tax=Castilleja foliolosa TaxID=1961234 RepID=A0ABD3B9V8_9LAMI
MDRRSDKQGPGRQITTKKVDQNVQSCNRTRCSGRMKNSQNSIIGSSDKPKCPNPPFRSSIRNETTRKPVVNNPITAASVRSPYLNSKTISHSQVKLDPSDMSRCGSSSASSSNVGPRKISHRPVSSYVPSSSRSSEQRQYNSESTLKKRRSLEGESSSSRGERKTKTASPADSTTRRSTIVNPRTRVYNRQNGGNNSSVTEHAVVVPEIRDNELLQFSTSSSRSFSLSGNSSDNPSDMMPFASDEREFTRFLNDDDDVFRQFDMGGINEMLLALGRIEQDEELTDADLLELETTLFLGGLNLYDRHREMRLDIDDMSYEELLALEERMGTVSTAIPHEALSKYLTRSIYEAGPLKVQITGSVDDGDDIKCSICQEEYVIGDEIGTLVKCKHGYHETCITRWLQLKNWCPVCKASAAPSQSASSL